MILKSILSLFFSVTAFASVKIGNGGLVAYCEPRPDKNIERIELPDFLEARFRWDLTLKHLHDETPWEIQIQQVLNRLAHRSPARASVYFEWLNSFLEESKFVDGFELPSTNDAIYLPFPLECKLKQAIVQIAPEVAQDKRYYINLSIWNELSENQKAGLVLHELIYREALKNNFEDSKWVRYFNALLWSESLENVDLNSWAHLFTVLLKVDYFEWKQYKVSQLKALPEGGLHLALPEQVMRFTFLKNWNIESFESGEAWIDASENIQTLELRNVKISGLSKKGTELRLSVAYMRITDFSGLNPSIEVNFLRNADFQSSKRLTKDWNYDAEEFSYGYLGRPGEQNRDALIKLRKDASSKICQKVSLPQSKYNLKFEIKRSAQVQQISFEVLDVKMQPIHRATINNGPSEKYESVSKNFNIESSQDYYLCLSAKAFMNEAWIRLDDFNLVPTDLEFKLIH